MRIKIYQMHFTCRDFIQFYSILILKLYKGWYSKMQNPYYSMVINRKVNSINNPNFNQIESSFKSIITKQSKQMNKIKSYCTQLEQKIQILAQTTSNLVQKHLRYTKNSEKSEKNNNKQILALQLKQNYFIINELNDKIDKLHKNQKELYAQLAQNQQKYKLQSLKIADLQYELKNSSKNDKKNILNLQQQLNSKNYQLQNLQHKIDHLTQKLSNKQSSLFEATSSMVSKCSQPQNTQQIKHLNSKIQDLQQTSKTKVDNLQKTIQKLNSQNYQFEIKLNQKNIMYKELESNYSELLQKNNDTEIHFHQQIMGLKKSFAEEKRAFKNYVKDFEFGVSQFAIEFFNKNNFTFSSQNPKQILSQLRKDITKLTKKKMKHITESNIEEIDKLTQQIYKKDQQIDILKKQNQQYQKSFPTPTILTSNFSADGTYFDRTYQNAEDKIKARFDSMKRQIKQKKNKIFELEEQISQQYTQNSQKFLKIEEQFLSKNNQCRKMEFVITQLQKEIESLKVKNRDLQLAKQQLKQSYNNQKVLSENSVKEKIQQYQRKMKTLKSTLKQYDHREHENQSKLTKIKDKQKLAENDAKMHLNQKNQKIEQMLKKIQSLQIQNRLLNEKLTINSQDINITQVQTTKYAKSFNEIINQQKSDTNQQLEDFKNKETDYLRNISILQHELSEKNSLIKQLKVQMSQQKQRSTIKLNKLTEQFQNIQQINKNYQLNQSKQDISEHLKNQLTRVNNLLLDKNNNIQQLNINLTHSNNLVQQSLKQYSILMERYLKSQQQWKQMNQTLKADLMQTIQQQIITIQELKNAQQIQEASKYTIKINNENEDKTSKFMSSPPRIDKSCNYSFISIETILFQQGSNTEETNVTEAICNTESSYFYTKQVGSNTQSKQMKTIQINTIIQVSNQSINTDIRQIFTVQIQTQPLQIRQADRQSIKSKQLNFLDELQSGQVQQYSQPRQRKTSNLFQNLIFQTPEVEDNFEIFEEGQSINIGQTEQNMKIKQVFNTIRVSIERLLDENEIEMVEDLPIQLYEDFNQFITYVKEKITQIKNCNEISFIDAVVGEEYIGIQSDIQYDLELIASKSQEKYKQTLEQKDLLISTLQNQKQNREKQVSTLKNKVSEELLDIEQEKTIAEYKYEIEQYRKVCDLFQMNCESLKNICKNLLEIWCDDQRLQDDFVENIKSFAEIADLSEQEIERLDFFHQQIQLNQRIQLIR